MIYPLLRLAYEEDLIIFTRLVLLVHVNGLFPHVQMAEFHRRFLRRVPLVCVFFLSQVYGRRYVPQGRLPYTFNMTSQTRDRCGSPDEED